jgi:hypothetical protein
VVRCVGRGATYTSEISFALNGSNYLKVQPGLKSGALLNPRSLTATQASRSCRFQACRRAGNALDSSFVSKAHQAKTRFCHKPNRAHA